MRQSHSLKRPQSACKASDGVYPDVYSASIFVGCYCQTFAGHSTTGRVLVVRTSPRSQTDVPTSYMNLCYSPCGGGGHRVVVTEGEESVGEVRASELESACFHSTELEKVPH